MAKKPRDYTGQKKYQATRQQVINQVARHKAERHYVKRTGHAIPAGYELDHTKALDQGGARTDTNIRLIVKKRNRGYKRDAKNNPIGKA